jgi:hypothetical protein
MHTHGGWYVAVLGLFSLAAAASTELSSSQKEGVCRLALSKANANAPSEYKLMGKAGDTLTFASAKGHSYSCEVFNLVIKLSSAGWGRIQPTGNVILEKGCVKLSLYDPGLMMTHSGEYCGK